VGISGFFLDIFAPSFDWSWGETAKVFSLAVPDLFQAKNNNANSKTFCLWI
jgi:hypothetical protein